MTPRNLRNRGVRIGCQGAAASALVVFLSTTASLAQTAEPGEPAPTGFWDRDTLTGDWDGFRTQLGDKGITFSAQEIAETLGNVTGGIHTGFIAEGRLTAGLSVDFEKAFGWHGGLFYTDAYWIQGHGLTTNNLGNLFTVSNIEGTRNLRLHDLYVQQSFIDDKISVRLGNLGVDDEFIISRYGANFVNAMFGWAGLPSNDIIPTGGPIYPFAAPGVRFKFEPSDSWSLKAGLFTANPAGPATSGNRNPNPQLREPSGTAFNLNSDILAITEVAYANAPDKDTPGLPATYTLGAWYDSGKFPDQRLDTQGVSLASAASNGVARTHVNDFSLYGIIDQMLWRKPGTEDKGLAGFLRVMGAPSDRNLISYYVDGGLNLLGTFPGRDDDIAGVAVAYGAISPDLQDLDRDFAGTATARPVHDYEMVIELTYQVSLAPWWVVQPDFQYVIHPGGNIANPQNPRSTLGDEAVIGVRTTITF
jgi:porin